MRKNIPSAPTLAETQKWMVAVVTSPEGVHRALKKIGGAERFIAQQEPLSIADRLRIYSYAYFQRLYESAADDFEATRKCLGDRAFRELYREYLENHPSRYTSVSQVGDEFPAFIRKRALTRRYPYLAELAELELHLVHAHSARDPENWDAKKLESLAPSAWEKLRFEIGASVFLMKTRWKLDACRRGLRGKPKPAAPFEFLLVYRDGFKPRVNVLTREQFRFLQAAAKGEALGQMCSKLSSNATVGEWLRDWSAAGILRPVLRK